MEIEAIVRPPELRTKYGITFSWTHIWRLEQEGRFPRRAKVVPGGNAVCWKRSEIEAWIAGRFAERDAKIATERESVAEAARRAERSERGRRAVAARWAKRKAATAGAAPVKKG